MKKIRSLTALACALTLTTGLFVGCGSSSSNGGSSSKKVTVNIFQFKVETKSALEKAVKDYESSHSNVTINVQTVGGGQDYGAALKTKFASGDEPTIYNIGGPQDVEDWKAKLEDLSDQPWVSKAYDGTLDPVKSGSKIYGLPFDMEGYGLIYNKTIFKKAGIDPSTIKTYEDLQKAAATLDSKKKDLGLEAVFGTAGKETWVAGLHDSTVPLALELKDELTAYKAKTINFTYADGFKKLLDLQNKYAYKPDGTNKSINSVDYSTQVEKLFSLSKVAMIEQGNWIYSTVLGINKDVADNMGLLPLPIDGDKSDCVPVGVPMYWAVNSKKDADTKKAAKDFLNWLYTSDKGKNAIINDFKFIPALKGYDAANLQPADPISKEITKYSKAGKTLSWVFNAYPTGWGQNKLGADIQKYTSGDLSWDQLVKNAKDSWAASRK